MEKIELGKSGLWVTKVGFGVLTVGNTQLNLSVEEGSSLLRYALERGINFLDTAQAYETYPYIREALKGNYQELVISTKSTAATYTDMAFALEEARREMDRDVIEIFLLHEVRHDGDFQLRQGAWECLNDAKAKGLIKAIGVSTHHVDVAEALSEVPECDLLFPLINFRSLGIRKGSGTGTKEEMEAAIQKSCENGLGIYGMKAFGGGNLTGQYIKALDYIYGVRGISSNMIGFGSKNEVDDILSYLGGRLPADYVPDVRHKKINIDQGDCEACYACIQKCPNLAIFINDRGLADINHEKCLTCGYCAPVCPVRAIIMF